MAALVCQGCAPKVIEENVAERGYVAFYIIIVEYCFSVIKHKGPVERIHIAQGSQNKYGCTSQLKRHS